MDPDRNTEDDEKRVRFYSNCRPEGGEGQEEGWGAGRGVGGRKGVGGRAGRGEGAWL